MAGGRQYPALVSWRSRTKALAVVAGLVVAAATVVVVFGFVAQHHGGLKGGPRHRVSRIADALAVSCPRPAKCFALIGPGVTHQGDGPGELGFTSDGGSTWSARSIPAAFEFRTSSLVCPTLSHCIATANLPPGSVGPGTSASVPGEFAVTWDAGLTWSEVKPPATTYGLSALSCGDDMHCIAAGYVGQLDATPPSNASFFWGTSTVYLSTGDGGLHWHAAESNLSTGSFSRSDCPLPTTCWVVSTPGGYEDFVPNRAILARTTDGGRTWRVVTSRIPGLPIADAISCVGGSFCVVAGGRDDAVLTTTVDAGLHWHTSAKLPATMNFGGSDTCPPRKTCSRLQPIIGIYCLTTRRCWATTIVDYWTIPQTAAEDRQVPELLSSTDGGSSWVMVAKLIGYPGNVLDCWATECMATADGRTQIVFLSTLRR